MTGVRSIRRRLDRSLLARVLASNFLLVGISVAVLTVLVLALQLAAFQRQLRVRARVVAEFVAGQSEFAMLVGDRAELERIARQALSVEDVVFVALADARADTPIVVTRADFQNMRIPPTTAQDAPQESTLQRDGARLLEVVLPVLTPVKSGLVEWESRQGEGARLGVVRLGVSMEKQTRLFQRTVRSVLVVAGGAHLLILGVQFLQMRRLLGPLQGLIEFTRHVGQGNLSLRAPIDRPDEVGRLAMAFNQMLEKLGATTVSRDYVDNVIRSMGESLIVIDVDGRIRTVNQATLSMLGYSEKELIGQPVSLILDAPAGCSLDHASQSCGERVYRKKDGSLVTVLLSCAGMQNSDGMLDGQVWVAQDITERMRAEEELRRAKQEAERANHAKSDFLSRTSHELRTPLNAILGFGQLLSLGELTPPDRESTEQILKAGQHLLRLINEVLDIAGIESGRRTLSMEPVVVAAAAEEALGLIQPLADQRNIVLENRISTGENRYVLGDYQRLKQVLLNLLSNAVKYNRERGRVILSCEERHDGRLRIAVSDNGPGITPENLGRLFVPFERLGAERSAIEGTGLGLALSKTLVAAMRGTMGVDSVVGQGSAFWFDLKMVEAPTALQPKAPEVRSVPAVETGTPDCTVLYIEDTLSNLQLMKRLLDFRPQVRLLSANCGLDGLTLARTQSPDLILLDVHLPDIRGDEVIRRLRAEPACSDIPIVVLSADATQNQVRRMLAEGAKAYLTKPLNLQQVLQLVDEAAKAKDFSHAV